MQTNINTGTEGQVYVIQVMKGQRGANACALLGIYRTPAATVFHDGGMGGGCGVSRGWKYDNVNRRALFQARLAGSQLTNKIIPR